MSAHATPGTAVLDVSVRAVDSTTGAPQSRASFGVHGNEVAYKVAYSCGAADCRDATVRMAPSQPDPNGLTTEPLLSYANWTAPAGLPDATIGGTDATGKTIDLGDLSAGRSGTFLVVYAIHPGGTYTTPRPAQYYPSGFRIEMAATLKAATAPAPARAEAAPVTWQNSVPEPSVQQANPGSVRAGTEVTWDLLMNTGAFVRASGSVVTGSSQWAAAGSYTVVEELDPRAEYVSSTGGGAYDAATHSVTWSLGTRDAPAATAAGGWGWAGTSGWSNRGPYHPRAVTVHYPPGRFTSDPGGCDFEATVSSTLRVTATYLDPDRSTRTAAQTMTHPVSCHEPFARADMAKDSTNSASSGPVRLLDVPPDVTGLTCPPTGRDDWNRGCAPGAALAPFADHAHRWTVTARNQANVPGVAVIEDDALGQADARVNRITTSRTTPAATVEWTRNDGTTGRSAGSVTAPAGTWFTAARTISGPLAPANNRPGDTGATPFHTYFHYAVRSSAPIGGQRTNTATATLSWPGSGLAAERLGPVSRTIRFRATPPKTPSVTAAFPSAAQVEGGGNAVPGKNVTFGVRGATANVPGAVSLTPQYVFLAPTGWTIDPDSPSFPAGSVPGGVTFDRTSRTVGGEPREVVVASWPDDVAFGENTTWPTLSVIARPGPTVAPGTRSVAHAWAGDSRHTWTDSRASYGGALQDAPDVDGDGSTDEWFSGTAQTVMVSSADGLDAVKEICLPTPGAPDGCTWLSDPDHPVGVSPTATDIRYRVTLKNTGNTTLSDVVAYDVLPHAGDHGTSAGTASVPRGSTFGQTVDSVFAVSPHLELAYSATTNPRRVEVHPSALGTTDDWGPAPAGKKAIRATVTGDLAPGRTARFGFVAAVAPGTGADAVACNSVALDSAQTLPAEPRPVCAATQEADLRIDLPDRLPWQVDRPGTLPFTVTHAGGSRETAATVTVTVPAGLTVTDPTPDGWRCTAEPGSAPLAGPLTLTCTPVDGAGGSKPLARGVSVPLDVPVTPTAAGRVCVSAAVTGPMHDPSPAHNDATGCGWIGAATAGLSVTQTDDRSAVTAGDTYAYTLKAANLLPAEDVTDAQLTDALPDGLAFVSASHGGTVTDRGPADPYGNRPGGTVTWALDDLGAAGPASPDGTPSAGGPAATATVRVKVRVLPGATGPVVNRARVSAPDPADRGETLRADATDSNGVRALTLSKASGVPSAGVSAGDTLTYTVTATHTGTADYPASAPAVLTDHLDGVLDDAPFLTGSASVTVGDGPPEALPDPTGSVLTWSGALPAGETATLTYRVRVGDDGDRTLRSTAYGGPAGTVCDGAGGRDGNGVPCATTSDGFAPVLTGSVGSTEQDDAGHWTVVHTLDVTNPNPGRPVGYDLTDELRFGPGIEVLDAAVTGVPDGVGAVTGWEGSGTVAADVELPGGATHRWTVTVTADAHGTAGTAPGRCVDGAAGGFANRAVLIRTDGSRRTADSCAAPAEPTVTKAVDGAPQRNEDGTWDIGYLVTVTNGSRTPAGGLVHGLDDTLTFPRGVRVLAVSAEVDGATANPGFNGGLTEVGGDRVTPDTALFTGTARVPAATAEGPGVRTHRVTVTARAEAMYVTARDVACGPVGGGGYGNTVTLTSTGTVVGTATACADVTVPQLHFTKAADTKEAVRPGDTITYTVTARNVGDADFVAGDPAGVEDDLSHLLAHARFNGDAAATAGDVVVGGSRMLWSTPIAAGGSETLTYSVTVGADTAPGTRIVNGLSQLGVDPGERPGVGPDGSGERSGGPSGGSSGRQSGGPSGGASGGASGGPGGGAAGGSGGGAGGASGGGAPGGGAGGRGEPCPVRPAAVPDGNCVVTTPVTARAAPPPSASSSPLAGTGTDLIGPALAAGAALTVGTALLVAARHRARRAGS
ncbi:hypothetical protein ACFVW2_29705 [Streptomyces sp. NPDC058171]